MAFDPPICGIGFRINITTRLAPKQRRSRIGIEFFDEVGAHFGALKRWPATGTTRQAFGPSDQDPQVGAIILRTNAPDGVAIDDLLLQPSAAPMS
jgi:hypothetical protein